ncbi:MAG: YHS domain-containing protein [Armatimonadia bacterium]
MARRSTLIVSLLAALTLALLTGCPKKEQTALQGAPPTAQPAPPASHTMPGGEQMPGMKMPASETAKTGDTVATSSEMASCPVLGTTMEKKKMIPYEYKGKTYYFCCPPCVEKFKANPEQYIKNPTPPKPPTKGM